MRYTHDWLCAEVDRKRRLKYLFFWGHQGAKDGSVTAACLSQWWAAPFIVDGVRYATAEHWMMAAKARLFGDQQAWQQILQVGSPAAAKAFGRNVRGFNPAIWDREKLAIVVDGNYHKFAQHHPIMTFLLGTGERVLVEASPVDAIWGIGLPAADPKSSNPRQWRGENLLGFALMEVRDRLRTEISKNNLNQ